MNGNQVMEKPGVQVSTKMFVIDLKSREQLNQVEKTCVIKTEIIFFLN